MIHLYVEHHVVYLCFARLRVCHSQQSTKNCMWRKAFVFGLAGMTTMRRSELKAYGLQEWAEGYEIRFGLYEWNPDGSQKRSFRGNYAEAVEAFSGLEAKVAAARKAPTTT